MKIRPDITELLRAGHTDTYIAHRVGCHRSTVHRTRQALGMPPDRMRRRLYTETLPAGVAQYNPRRPLLSPAETAANRAALAEAIRPRRPNGAAA